MHRLAQVSADSKANTVTENIPCGRDGATSIVISPRFPARPLCLDCSFVSPLRARRVPPEDFGSGLHSTFRATEKLCHSAVPPVAS